jgi:hypothetical protein
MKKWQSQFVIVLLVIIAVALVALVVKLFAPSITGNVVKPTNNEIEDYHQYNNFADFMTGCIRECPEAYSGFVNEACKVQCGKETMEKFDLNSEELSHPLVDILDKNQLEKLDCVLNQCSDSNGKLRYPCVQNCFNK